jgi:acid phosphatase
VRTPRSVYLALLAGLLLGCVGPKPAERRDPLEPAAAAAARGLAHERLHAVLWMQTSAEYPAATLQVYRMARHALELGLADPGWSALPPGEAPAGARDLPPAVLTDVDETLLRNVGIDRTIIRENVGMDRAALAAWTRAAAAPAVPGAREFLAAAAARGVAILYVTNRTADEEEATLRNLAALGFPVPEGAEQILMRGERPEWTEDKASRRRFVGTRYRVLLLLGDALGDFASDAGLSPAARRALGEQYADRWGVSWFLLPNPSYGGFEEAARGGAEDDLDGLRRKRALLAE